MSPDSSSYRSARILAFFERIFQRVIRLEWIQKRYRSLSGIFRFLFRPERWWISNFLFYLLRLLLQVWTTVFLLAMLALLITQLDQAHDYFDDFANKDLPIRLLSYLAVCWCAFITWFGTRLQFLLFDTADLFKGGAAGGGAAAREGISYRGKNFDSRFFGEVHADHTTGVTSRYIKYTPGVLGTIPFCILIAAFAHAGNGPGVCTTLGLIAIFWAMIGPVKNYVQGDTGEEAYEDDSDKVTNEKKFSSLRPPFRLLVYAIWGVCGVFFVLTPFFEITLWGSRQLGIIAIAFLAFSVWIWILVFVNILNNYFKPAIHLFLVIVFFAAFLYPNNNNHVIRVIDEPDLPGYVPKSLGDSLSIDDHFHRWFRRLAAQKSPQDTVHVYLVAAEGGGIRAAYWAAGVLARLEEAAGLTPHIFAISGVSGGSVGAGFYVSLYRDFLPYRKDRQTGFPAITRCFMEKDYLSPLLTAGLGPDMFQKLLFFKIPSFDRARYLEDSWARDYEEITREPLSAVAPQVGPGKTGFDTFNRAFDDIWRLKNGHPQLDLPVLFLNSTHVDRGQKAILTPLSFRDNTYFRDVVDVLEEVRRDIPFKTALSMSARFPGFTPPAVVNDPRNMSAAVAHYVDGGYVDNSGLETTMGILSTLLLGHYPDLHTDTTHAKTHPFARIHVVFIKNSSQSMASPLSAEKASPVHSLYEATDPVRTFFNAWDNSLRPKIALAEEFLRNASFRSQKGKLQVDEHLYILELDRESGRMPLGWQLSRTAVTRMARQLDLLVRQREFVRLTAPVKTP